MPDSATNTFAHALLQAWHPEYGNAFVLIAFLLFILVHTRSEGWSILKHSLVFLLLALVSALASGVCQYLGMLIPVRILDEIAVILVGILTIRVFGLSLFRVFLPTVHLIPPRILEDIILVLAYVAWGMVRMSQAGVNLSGLVTTSAVITGIIAFSMQDTLGNILGGLALQLDNSVSIGNWIKVDDISGQVIEVHWRHTAVRTRNGEVVVIPNSLLMKAKVTIIGGEDVPQWRRWIYFSLSNRIPPQRVIEGLEKALREAEIPLVSKNPAPQCVLMDYKDGLSVYAMRYWLTNAQVDDPTDSLVRVHIFAALQRQGYGLASPALDVHMTAESTERDTQLHETELALRQRTLRQMALFSTLSDEECTHLAKTLTYTPFVKGDIITRQGAVAHWLYVLISGEVDIWYEVNKTERKLLTTLPAGHVFGEMGLMTGEPRRATVMAKSDVECYRIDKPSFELIIHSRPALAVEFAHILSERNMQLVAVQQGVAENHDQHQARILDGIKRFFRLGG
jgi:small-conductance mechanosensitive channel